MTDGQTTAGNGAAAQPQIRILAQYIKDFSLENPNIETMLAGPTEQPKLEVSVNVGARAIEGQPNHFESAIEFRAVAANSTQTIYEMELVYGGLFRLDNMPQQALEPFLLINCPMLLFPFVRRIAADMTREAGYPPLLLDPIDFASLYVERQRRGQGQQAANDQS
jgi:preprotein translocase subunit SecB